MSQLKALLLVRADGSQTGTSLTCCSLSVGDPFADVREIACAGADGVSAGVINSSGAWSCEAYPFTEMLVVHRGHVSLRANGKTLEIGPGESVVIGQGSACRIDAAEGSLWAFCAVISSAPSTQPALTWIDRQVALEPAAAPEASILIGPTPQCRSHTTYEDPNSSLRIGVWDSTPYARGGRPHKVHELMHLIEGQVTLTDADGTALTVNTGETVFVPQGASCAWQSDVYVRKYYVVV
ncbi:cupin domain-containing protein [Pseudomonas caspiana]|uniref:Cupin n=1 Tax=Pseudomonas caspiana TaxID=1451454 RepID=A0A1Y3P2D7_9PSED|nr:cupin domain-containing protein [Pseudomonas caspiana]OUM73980.1 cupin [Pseudomonas caspiana]